MEGGNEKVFEGISTLIERLGIINNKMYGYEQDKFEELSKSSPDYTKLAAINEKAREANEERVVLRNAIEVKCEEISGGHYKARVESRTWGTRDY